jgi:hypothetical protein
VLDDIASTSKLLGLPSVNVKQPERNHPECDNKDGIENDGRDLDGFTLIPKRRKNLQSVTSTIRHEFSPLFLQRPNLNQVDHRPDQRQNGGDECSQPRRNQPLIQR